MANFSPQQEEQVGKAHKQIVPVPDHLQLLFLPPYSPKISPAEDLLPLTNTALANRHCAAIEDVEEALAERCLALQALSDHIRSTTRFSWCPARITQCRGLRYPERHTRLWKDVAVP